MHWTARPARRAASVPPPFPPALYTRGMSIRRFLLSALAISALPILAACSSQAGPDATVDDPLGIDGAQIRLTSTAVAPALATAAEPQFTGALTTRTIEGPIDVPDAIASATIDVGFSQIDLEPPEDAGYEHPARIHVQEVGLTITLDDGPNGSFETVGIQASITEQNWRFDRAGDCPADASCSYEPAGSATFPVTLQGDALDRWRTILTGGLPNDTVSGSAFLEFDESLDAVAAVVTISAPDAALTLGAD